MTNETRVGFMATSMLEEFCSEYIASFTIKGKFEGDVKYLDLYKMFADYNNQD